MSTAVFVYQVFDWLGYGTLETLLFLPVHLLVRVCSNCTQKRKEKVYLLIIIGIMCDVCHIVIDLDIVFFTSVLPFTN